MEVALRCCRWSRRSNSDYSTAINLWHTPNDEAPARRAVRAQPCTGSERSPPGHHRALGRWPRSASARLQHVRARRPRHLAAGARSLTLEHELRAAGADAAAEAAGPVSGFHRILERFDYLREGRPTGQGSLPARHLRHERAHAVPSCSQGGAARTSQPDEIARLVRPFSAKRRSRALQSPDRFSVRRAGCAPRPCARRGAAVRARARDSGASRLPGPGAGCADRDTHPRITKRLVSTLQRRWSPAQGRRPRCAAER